MKSRRAPLRKNDLSRALDAMAKIGQPAHSVRIEPNGAIIIACGASDSAQAANPWDIELQ